MAVSTFIVTCVPSCCSLRELRLAMSRCEVLGRASPGRAGWRSLAVVGGRAASRPCEGSQPSVRGAGLLAGRALKGVS